VSGAVHERAGVIVIRVWVEDASEAGPRARITASNDLSSGEQTVAVAQGAEDILAVVRSWLDAFLAG